MQPDVLASEKSRSMRQFVLFGIAGVLGFLVDAGVVLLTVNGWDWNPYLARLLSFLCAVIVTFSFNRRHTFADSPSQPLWRQAGRYLFAMMGGFVVNYTSYALLVHFVDLVRAIPVIGVAVGSVAGWLVNFASSRFWVFGRGKTDG